MGTVSAEPKEYEDYVQALSAAHPALARELTGFHGISDVLDWMNRRGLTVIDMVGQDEFEYDFLVGVPPNWLSFGVT